MNFPSLLRTFAERFVIPLIILFVDLHHCLLTSNIVQAIQHVFFFFFSFSCQSNLLNCELGEGILVSQISSPVLGTYSHPAHVEHVAPLGGKLDLSDLKIDWTSSRSRLVGASLPQVSLSRLIARSISLAGLRTSLLWRRAGGRFPFSWHLTPDQ